MAATHYDPFGNDDDADFFICGTPAGENYNTTNNKEYVSCKKCIKAFSKTDDEIKEINYQRNSQDAVFIEFCIQEGF